MPKKTKDDSNQETDSDSNKASDSQMPAIPPPDDPLRRAQEFDPDREQKSREMAEKRLEAMRKTREMPTANEEAAASKSEENPSQAESDST
jgi:hypothetical protein